MIDLVRVTVDLTNPGNQTLWLKLEWTPTSKIQKLNLPVWTPGSYTVRDHVQNLHSLKLYKDNNLIDVEVSRVSPSEWQFSLNDLHSLTLKYAIEAREFNLRSCYFDTDIASLCMSGVIMLIDDHRWSKHYLDVQLPEKWNLFLPLEKLHNDCTFCADNYDDLVDAPLHAGKYNSVDFMVRGNPHELIILGEAPKGVPNNLVLLDHSGQGLIFLIELSKAFLAHILMPTK